jgi:predicted AAA+ superfamily ATPase
MHPVTLSELCEVAVPDSIDGMLKLASALPSTKELSANLDALLRLGGFPEPLLAGSERQAARFRLAYGTRLVREDLRDLESIRDLDRVELLFDRLPAGVGSLLSVNALREDLEVSFESTETWLRALERLYAVFRVAPFGPPRIKAIKKSQKLYFWDWSRVEGEAARLENLVMLHLLRLVHWMADVHGEKAELRFFRDAAGHEVDAIVLRKGKPWLAVEVKTSDEPVDRGLRYLLERQPIPWAFQLSLNGTRDTFDRSVGAKGVRLMPVAKLLARLP